MSEERVRVAASHQGDPPAVVMSVLLLALCTVVSSLSVGNVDKFAIRMPLVEFSPLAEQRTAHHMLLYGCDSPGRKEEMFSCGEMGLVLPGTEHSAPC